MRNHLLFGLSVMVLLAASCDRSGMDAGTPLGEGDRAPSFTLPSVVWGKETRSRRGEPDRLEGLIAGLPG
jgi:hypothetical protein